MTLKAYAYTETQNPMNPKEQHYLTAAYVDFLRLIRCTVNLTPPPMSKSCKNVTTIAAATGAAMQPQKKNPFRLVQSRLGEYPKAAHMMRGPRSLAGLSANAGDTPMQPDTPVIVQCMMKALTHVLVLNLLCVTTATPMSSIAAPTNCVKNASVVSFASRLSRTSIALEFWDSDDKVAHCLCRTEVSSLHLVQEAIEDALHNDCTEERTQYLEEDVRKYQLPLEPSEQGLTDGDCWIQMSTTDIDCDEQCKHQANTPTESICHSIRLRIEEERLTIISKASRTALQIRPKSHNHHSHDTKHLTQQWRKP